MTRSRPAGRGQSGRNTNRFDNAGRQTAEARWHSHEGGQFILVEAGTSHLVTEIGAWIIPARRVSWIPPGVMHASRSGGAGRGWVVLAPVGLARNLPRQVCVLRATSLMIACLQRLTLLSPRERALRRWLWKIVAREMRDAQPEELDVPMPSTPRIRNAVQTLLNRPTIAADLSVLAAASGLSRRSFTRHFRAQTGLSFARWARAIIAHHAVERIAAGDKVSSVAFDTGYESVSAFIAMFRRQLGASPREFLSLHSQEYLSV